MTDRLLAREREVVERTLARLLPTDAWPERLHRAMAHAVFAGGKRLRPVLARIACRAAGGDADRVTEAACGLELIHTYSLIHDDLPAFDDDVLRRGRPTVHVAFDEATAILAGDALLAEGLLLLARYPEGEEWAGRRAAAVELVADAVSARGMVGGQMEDLEATGQVAGAASDPHTRLERIHRAKTGRLLGASVELGAVLAGTAGDRRAELAAFGADLGLAFQIADDILDATASASELGKSPGKDADAGKLTYVTLYGLDRARARLAELEGRLVASAARIEGAGGELAAVARFVARRTS
ncbi:MAG: polyprenyl synthetase family protein [Thermoanaerobaculales bacterium]|nr:polyprenyl synthetase family protein [Thermoanaerobaculales bacterium]